MQYPLTRMRRLRENTVVRNLVRENHLRLDDLIMPLFVVENMSGEKEPITSMPGQFRFSLNALVEECRRLSDLGIQAVLLFGIPAQKDPVGSGGYAPNGIIQRAVSAITKALPHVLVITDICLCEYTSHGHCGVVEGGRVVNDSTLKLLTKTAVSHAEAGAHMVAPSDMMDGRVRAIRETLDAAGFSDLPVMSYAAKYASAYYGPFREAAESAPQFGDRKSYQMDPANVRMALQEVALDIAEGADIVMVKPAMAYLDVVRAVRERFSQPLACYNVSGEYAMIKAAAANGWINERLIVMETLTGMKRAGADMILTYFAPDVAGYLAD